MRRDVDGLMYGRFLPPLLLLIPLLLSWAWGSYFVDDTYLTYRFAQNLAAGRGLVYDAARMPSLAAQLPPVSPLFVTVLALLAPVMQPVGLLLSGLGWGWVALIVWRVGEGMKRPYPALIAPLFIIVSPLLPLSLGSAIPWAIGLGWLTIATATTHSKRHRFWLGAAFLLLSVHFDASTLALVVLLLTNRWWREKRPFWEAMFLLLSTAGWVWFVAERWDIGGWIRPFSTHQPLIHLLQSHELLWVFVPLALLGGWTVWEKREETKGTQWILLWTALVWLTGSELIGGVTAVTTLFLTSLGIDWLVHRLTGRNNAWQLALFLTIPLLFIQLITLGQQYQARPIAQFALETDAADWLQAHSPPDTTLYATARIGYLAQRTTLPTAVPTTQLYPLIAAEPDYLISDPTLAWNDVTGSGWVRQRYVPIQQYTSDYAPFSPLTIWEHTLTPFDEGQPEPISVILPNQVEMVGYKFEPKVIQPGEDVYLTVYLQATQPITVGFRTQANLTYLQDEWVWAWSRESTPQSMAGHAWQPSQIIPERFKLESEDKIPYGAYKVQVFWRWIDEGPHWPVYRDNDSNTLDRVLLGYVAVPPPADDAAATPTQARFDDQILLTGYELAGTVSAGEMVEIVLYWQALRLPDDDYFVFVHLLDEAGQFITSHDGQPMDGRFSTRAWQPEITVPDSHPLTLPPDLPPGRYQVMVGLYQRETGARLPVWDADGVEQANGSWPLVEIEVESKE